MGGLLQQLPDKGKQYQVVYHPYRDELLLSSQQQHYSLYRSEGIAVLSKFPIIGYETKR